jgi:hypothetical protein
MERIFIHEETKAEVIAINDIQAEALKNEGFKEIDKKKK